MGTWGRAGGVNARGGQACLAQARQDRPGFGELDLTEYCYETLKVFASSKRATARFVFSIENNSRDKPLGSGVLPTIPEEGWDVEIVPADSRQGCHLGLTRWNVCVDADRLR